MRDNVKEVILKIEGMVCVNCENLIEDILLDNNGVKKTLDEIGSQYGVSRERIRQIENRAISKLKKLCKNEKLHDGLINYFGS